MATVFDISTLTSDDGFIVQGGFGGGPFGDQAGFSVSSAGDVNGDGFEDFIVAAINEDEGGSNSGAAYVIFGRARGLGLLDLTALAPADGFKILGDAANDLLGYSSASGDVNGDGFDDIILGARDNDAGGSNAGAVYVVFGKASGFATVDLGSLAATDGFVIQGDLAGDQAGFDVSSGFDHDNDGFDEIVIGAPLNDAGGTDAGRAYVIRGKATFANLDLSTLSATDGYRITGDAAYDNAGRSVSSAGDVNGDGFDDVIVGARFGGGGGDNAGEAYIIYGFGPSDFPLLFEITGDISPVSGFIIQGDVATDNAGRSVASAGDVNGDGLDDLIVGAPLGDDGGSAAGEAYVVFGRAGGPITIDLTGLAPTDGFIIQGDSTADEAGTSVSSAGDFNGDGFDDLIVGAPLDDAGGGNAGAAYVVFGKASGFATIDLTGIAAADGFMIQGDAGGDNAGFSVSSAGDVNNDGFDDIIVGARIGDNGGTDSGEAYVILGRAGVGATIDLTGLAPTDGFIIQGDFTGDRAGWAVSSAGDVNGDGFDDLIVGAPYNDDGGNLAGEAYVVFGKASGFATIDLTGLAATDGFVIQGDDIGDNAGFGVSSAGDVNGDGFDDIVVGARNADGGGTDSGEAYVIFGKAAGFATIDLTSFALADGFVIQGAAAGDYAGYSVSGAGDVNGDGFDDIIVGARGAAGGGTDAGEAYLIFGQASGFGTVDLASLTAAEGFIIRSDADFDQVGRSVAAAGDVDGDGFDDLIVGGPFGDAGEAYVIFGRKPTKAVTRTGSAADQTIRGGDYDDVLSGLGGVDVLDGGSGDDVLAGGIGADTLQGGAGIDGVDYAGNFGAVKVDLTTGLGRFNYAEGDVLTDIENVFGTDYGDILMGNSGVNVLVGNAGDDTIMGGAGADTMNGGTGTDLADYAGNFGAVSVNLATGVGLFNYAQGDVLTDFENLNGTEFGDILTGSSGVNILNGNSGDDTISGGAGADTLNGGAGTDNLTYAGNFGGISINLLTNVALFNYAQGDLISGFENVTGTEFGDILTGSAGVNVLNGNGGDDTISGGAAGDTLNGGAGTDTLTYAGNFGGVSIDLLTGAALFNYAQGDVVSGFENVIGTSYGDILRGNIGVNVLTGGVGNDTLDGGTGADVLDGGADVDTADYAGEFGAVSVNLATGTGRFNAAEGDTLTGIEKVIGTSYGDILEGNSAANTFTGGAGNDEFKFAAGFSLDIITDFVGNGAAAGDTIRFAAGLFTDYNDMIASSAQVGADVVITLDASNTLTLQNTILASLDSSDFLFG